MNWAQYARVLHSLGWKGFPGINTLAYWDIHKLLDQWSVVNMVLEHNVDNYFTLNSRIVPNKLECFIALGWKGLPGTNTLAYWAIHKLLIKWSIRPLNKMLRIFFVIYTFKKYVVVLTLKPYVPHQRRAYPDVGVHPLCLRFCDETSRV
jgi:hypothetical protein